MDDKNDFCCEFVKSESLRGEDLGKMSTSLSRPKPTDQAARRCQDGWGCGWV